VLRRRRKYIEEKRAMICGIYISFLENEFERFTPTRQMCGIITLQLPVKYPVSHDVYSSEFESEASRPWIRIVPWFWSRHIGVISDTLNIRLRLFPTNVINVKRTRNRIRSPLRPYFPNPSDEIVQDDCKHDRAYDTSNNCPDRPLAQRMFISGEDCC